MAFDEVQFSPRIAFGAKFSRERRTEVIPLGGGGSHVNSPWSESLRRAAFESVPMTFTDADAIRAFWEARGGGLRGFRFKCRDDWKSCAADATPAATDQNIGTGDDATTTFQLRKAYTSGGVTTYRAIRKPVSGSVLIAVNGTPLGSGWTVDTTMGVVTFSSAPADGLAVTAGYEFDTPMRFEGEPMEVGQDYAQALRFMLFSLVEVRL